MHRGLVVDPVPLSRPLLRSALRDCMVSWADTGDQGLNLFTEALLLGELFDFVLIDTAVRRPSVARFLAELHKLEAKFQVLQPAALILMSSSGRLTMRADPLMPQLAGFLCRPFQAHDLHRCLEQAGLHFGTAAPQPGIDEAEAGSFRTADEETVPDPDESSGELIVVSG